MSRTWQLRNETWQLPEEGAIMGILNVTPDSFSDGGKHCTVSSALRHAQQLISEGVDIIDIGGESTRPGATPISAAEEQHRVLPVLQALRHEFPELRISVDTRQPTTAQRALEAGADIINDITGLTNPDMLRLCATQPCGIIIMHMKGTPFCMPDAPYYINIVSEVRQFFAAQVELAEAAGIDPARVCLDPGIGFGKNVEQNLSLIHGLAELRVRNLPLLMGLSRKRFLAKVPPPSPDTLNILRELPPLPPGPPSPAHPTVAMSMLAADNGADVHRVHDVAPHRKALRLRLLAQGK